MNDLRVLVVSEQSDSREALRDVLSVEGFEVQDVSSGVEGRRFLNRCQSPSVVLLGLMGTPRTGLDFVRIAEHETQLLRIAQTVLNASAPETDSKHEEITVRELIARRRTHQQSVASVLRPLAKARPRAAPPPEIRYSCGVGGSTF